MVNGRLHLRNVLLGNWVTLQHRSMHSPNHMTLGTTAVWTGGLNQALGSLVFLN